MTKTIEWMFCGLMAFATAGHLYGTFVLTTVGSGLFVWSLAGVLAAALIAALNVLRASRQDDAPLAWIALTGSLCWVAIAVLFGLSIGNVFDPRVLVHVVAAAGLSYFSFLTVRGSLG